MQTFARGLDAQDLGAELEDDALLLQDALELLGHLAVEAGRDAVEHLDHGHLRAEPPPHRAELEPDIARADDHQPLWHFGERQRAGGGDDPLLVDGDAGDCRDVGARSDDDALGYKRLLAAVWARHLDLARSHDPALAAKRLDLVLLEQELHALDVARDTLILEGLHGGEIELGPVP